MEPVLDKTLLVRQKGGFTRLPLVYERAFGGIGWPDNPFGVGALAGTGEASVLDPTDERSLAGFGPIGAAWATRKKRLGSTPRKTLEASFVEIPDDFDWGFYAAAPADQRVPFLRGDEWIVMDGLHPMVTRLRMRLPGARGLARVYGLSRWGVAEGQPLALPADTLRIDGDEQLCTLTFRGAFPIVAEEALAELRAVAGVELPGEPIAWPAPDRLPVRVHSTAGASGSQVPERTTKWADGGPVTLSSSDFESVDGAVLDGTLALGPEPPREALPFRPGAAPQGPGRRATVALEVIPDFATAMPFRAGTSPLAQPSTPGARVAPPPPTGGSSTVMLDGNAPEPPGPALPFRTEPVARPAPPSAPPPPAPPAVQSKEAPASPWAPAPPAPAPPKAPPPPPPQAAPAASPALKKGLYGRFGGKH